MMAGAKHWKVLASTHALLVVLACSCAGKHCDGERLEEATETIPEKPPVETASLPSQDQEEPERSVPCFCSDEDVDDGTCDLLIMLFQQYMNTPTSPVSEIPMKPDCEEYEKGMEDIRRMMKEAGETEAE